MANGPGDPGAFIHRDGRAWRVGTQADVAWIEDHTSHGLAVTSAIPAVFESYATIVIPTDDREEHDAAILRILTAETPPQPWWLGFLHTTNGDAVFVGAPTVSMYADWPYEFIQAGPEQAATWRPSPRSWRGDLPDIMFPTDRSWLISRLWDDDWWCLGGSATLVRNLVRDPGFQARHVNTVEDATPPGHTAR